VIVTFSWDLRKFGHFPKIFLRSSWEVLQIGTLYFTVGRPVTSAKSFCKTKTKTKTADPKTKHPKNRPQLSDSTDIMTVIQWRNFNSEQKATHLYGLTVKKYKNMKVINAHGCRQDYFCKTKTETRKQQHWERHMSPLTSAPLCGKGVRHPASSISEVAGVGTGHARKPARKCAARRSPSGH